MGEWQRLRRGIARLLCWTLLLQSSPSLAHSFVLRPEPRGWETAVRWAGSAHTWMDARGNVLRQGAELWLEEGERLVAHASQGSQPAPHRAPVTPTPPVPPGFQATSARTPIVAAALAGDLLISPGWNLVSLPTKPLDPSPQTVFGPMGSSLRRAFAYDACDTGDPWKVYDPSNSAGSDLAAVDERLGLWVDATQASALPSPGPAPLSTTIHLCSGWNLIGFPAEQARPVASALISIAGKYQRIFGYDAADLADPWEVYDVSAPAWANDLQVLRPGRGYWILATAETDLIVTNQGSELAVEIARPAQLQEVTEPTRVVGTVQGQALASWELRYRSVEEGADWVSLAAGMGAVSNASLATFDPTLLLNGMYEIELSALDVSGGGVSLSAHVAVEGQQKIGNFTLSFVDLEVPLAGIPIQVIRTYDSREKRSRDFGYGWTLDVRQGSYRNNRKPGEGWRIVKGFVPCQAAQETKPHLTTVRLSDREVYRFRLKVSSPAITLGGCFAQAGFAFVDGPVPGASLDILGGTELFYANGSSDVVDPATFETYEPKKVRLTTRDGRVFDLDLAQGLTRLADTNGNTLQITGTGITHSSGKSIAWTRDGQGRITVLTDPLGKTVTYTYDAGGDLVAVTDRENQTVRFTYNGSHGLLTIEDPRGIQPIRNEYDASGRLLRHTDAFGKTIELTHDLADHEEVVTDRLGHSRTLEYDARGNVVRETDALGKVTSRTFDDNDLLLSETNPLDQTTTYTYDAGRNLTSIRDPLGNTTGYTYNARGQVLTTTDPRGKTARNVYDVAGNLLQTTDPLGNVTASSYDSRGNLLTQTDPTGSVTTFAYDGAGNLTEQTDALGTATTYTYDAAGNRLTETTSRTLPNGTKATLVTRFGYDRLGRLTSTVQPDGSSTGTVYNAIGQASETIDPLGRHTSFTYDALGQQTLTRYPDGTTESRAYDAEGRLAATTDRGGRVTTYLYDVLGRLERTTFPDTASMTSTYDEAGRLVASTDARDNTTTYEYDAAGRRTQVLDALGGQTDFEYDAAGNQVAVTDANRQTTSVVYDDAGRLVRTSFPDGTSRQVEYDELGRRVAETDQAGKTTRFGYDALGRLIAVTDALNQVTRYTYDEPGNRISQTDANGHTTRFEYDSLGRMTRRVLPDGAAEQLGYDAAGNLTSKRDFAGRTIGFSYDLANRLTQKTYPGGTSVGFTYTATGRRASMVDARGATSYTYDARDRLAEMVYSDGRKLTYGWDANGNRTAVTAQVAGQVLTTSFTYDPLNRLNTVTDPIGRGYSHGYDANGNRTSVRYPNGVQTTYAYDALNRLKELRTRTSVVAVVAGYVYTLGAAGNRTKIEEADGTVRSYEYDALYRLIGETVARGGATVYTKLFGYDPVGNRLQQVHTDAVGTVTTTNATYDVRDRQLTLGGQGWTWDANGNLAGKVGEATYTWDFDSRLQQVTLQDGTVVTHTYDADGVRVRSVTRKSDGTTTAVDYLVDTAGALSQVVAESTQVGAGVSALSAYYVRGDDLLAVMRPGAAAGGWASHFYHADGLGSIRALTDESAAVTDRYEFTAFGEPVEHEGEDPNAFLFAGEQLDPNSGFYYNRARWMDPGVGRFVSSDPFAGATSEPLSLHKYLYSHCDPMGKVDPTGRSVAEWAIVAASLAALFFLVLPAIQRADQRIHGADEFVLVFGSSGLLPFSLWYSIAQMAELETAVVQNVRHDFRDFDVRVRVSAVSLTQTPAVRRARFAHFIPFSDALRDYCGADASDALGCYNGGVHAFVDTEKAADFLGAASMSTRSPAPNLGHVARALANIASHELAHSVGVEDDSLDPFSFMSNENWDAPNLHWRPGARDQLRRVLGAK
jgi:RHS repeat-associated protein